MVHVALQNPTLRRLRECRGLAALAACLMLGACGQLPDLGAPEHLAISQAGPQPELSTETMNDLAKATDY